MLISSLERVAGWEILLTSIVEARHKSRVVQSGASVGQLSVDRRISDRIHRHRLLSLGEYISSKLKRESPETVHPSSAVPRGVCEGGGGGGGGRGCSRWSPFN